MTVFLPPTFRVSTPIPAIPQPKIMGGGQSNEPGQAVQAFPPCRPSGRIRAPYYIRCEDEKLSRPGFWEPTAGYYRDQSVPAAFNSSIGAVSVKHGWEPFCESDLATAGKTPIFASHSRSGTAISHWAAGQPGLTFFDNFITELLATPGVTNANWHYVWCQGENDASLGTPQATYTTALTDWAAHVRSKLPACRIYIIKLNTNLAPGGATAPNVALIQAAQSAFVGADSNAELIDCDAFGYVVPHYTSAGNASIGSLIATRVQANPP